MVKTVVLNKQKTICRFLEINVFQLNSGVAVKLPLQILNIPYLM